VKVSLWGTRGSIASAGPETMRYGGNTSCVEVEAGDGTIVILDAGTGIRRTGASYETPRRLDVLLTHLHMDHIQGLGFFGPFFDPDFEVHVWGPPSATQDLRTRLTRYFSPPLFPVRLRDVDSGLELHDVPLGPFQVGGLTIVGAAVIHPGQTLGYRVTDASTRRSSEEGTTDAGGATSGDRASSDGRATAGSAPTLAYIPDHEPALGLGDFPGPPDWTSGFDIAKAADLLVHDAQYTDDEYTSRVGWGHSRLSDAVALAASAGSRRLVTFHHDPAHDDTFLDGMLEQGRALATEGAVGRAVRDGPHAPPFEIVAGQEGSSFSL
jgi:phosphoribosyl 1,2-cyclic phosphodiesterase